MTPALTSAGMLAGGLTSSPTLAAAQEAVRGGVVVVPDGMTSAQLLTNITTGYAITYVFGLVGLILLIRLLPRLMRIQLPEAAAQLAAEVGLESDEDKGPGPDKIVTRAYEMTSDELLAQGGQRSLFLRREGSLLPEPETEGPDRLVVQAERDDSEPFELGIADGATEALVELVDVVDRSRPDNATTLEDEA